MRQISILIVDDHPIMRVGIAVLINSSKEMACLGQSGTGEEAIQQHALLSPDVTLMDLRLPGISGVETIRRIRSVTPEARFIVLTTYEGDEDIHQAMEAGASGYLVKGLPQEMLVNAVRKVHAGGRYLPSPMELGITEATVKCHVSVILMRLNATDRTQAVITGLQRGLIHL